MVSWQPLGKRGQFTTLGHIPLAATGIPPGAQGFDAIFIGEGGDEIGAAHWLEEAGAEISRAPVRQDAKSLNSREQPEHTSRSAYLIAPAASRSTTRR